MTPIEENLSRLNHQVGLFLSQINTLLSLFEEVNKKADTSRNTLASDEVPASNEQ